MNDTDVSHSAGYWMWRKSSFSEGGNNACVEVAHSTQDVGVRDSKNSAGPKLVFGRDRWLTFVSEVSATDVSAH